MSLCEKNRRNKIIDRIGRVNIKFPWEDETDYKLRTKRGDILYIIAPSQDGAIRNGAWGLSVEVTREDSRLFNFYRPDYKDRIVAIPSRCHLNDGGVNWEQVSLMPDINNPTRFQVVLVGQD